MEVEERQEDKGRIEVGEDEKEEKKQGKEGEQKNVEKQAHAIAHKHTRSARHTRT